MGNPMKVLRDWWYSANRQTPGQTSMDHAKEIRARLDAAGYVIVPKEPTVEMLAAVYPSLGIPERPIFADCYRIMVRTFVEGTTTPKAGVAGGEDV